MNIQKWNHKLRAYEPYKVPEGIRIALYCSDMNEIVNCAQCFKSMRYGDCFTSREVHTNVGLGYAVCEECYDKEWERERNADHNTRATTGQGKSENIL